MNPDNPESQQPANPISTTEGQEANQSVGFTPNQGQNTFQLNQSSSGALVDPAPVVDHQAAFTGAAQFGLKLVLVALLFLAIPLVTYVGYKTYRDSKGIDISSWRAYCDSQVQLCFKYPADWKVSDRSTPTVVAKNIVSPDGTENAVYLDAPSGGAYQFSPNPGNAAASSSSPANFYTMAINSVSGTGGKGVQPDKVIEGYIVNPSGDTPSIWLANDLSDKSIDSLQVGRSSQVRLPFPFDNGSTGRQIIFSAGPIGNPPLTDQQTQAWFGSDETKTLVEILQTEYGQVNSAIVMFMGIAIIFVVIFLYIGFISPSTMYKWQRRFAINRNLNPMFSGSEPSTYYVFTMRLTTILILAFCTYFAITVFRVL